MKGDVMDRIALREFPRSLAVVAGAVKLLQSLDPINAFIYALGAFGVGYLVRLLFADGPGRGYWAFCYPVFALITFFVLRWVFYVVVVVIALVKGAPFLSTIVIMGGVLLVDVFSIYQLRRSING